MKGQQRTQGRSCSRWKRRAVSSPCPASKLIPDTCFVETSSGAAPSFSYLISASLLDALTRILTAGPSRNFDSLDLYDSSPSYNVASTDSEVLHPKTVDRRGDACSCSGPAGGRPRRVPPIAVRAVSSIGCAELAGVELEGKSFQLESDHPAAKSHHPVYPENQCDAEKKGEQQAVSGGEHQG